MQRTTTNSSHNGIHALNYYIHECFLPRVLSSIQLMTLFFPSPINAASLEPAASKAWEQYIESANLRMEQRLSPAKTFLWVDEVPDRLAKVRTGEIVISPVGPQNPKRVPSGLIHDWVGAIFIPHTTLDDVLQVVRDYGRYKDFYPPTVVDSKNNRQERSARPLFNAAPQQSFIFEDRSRCRV